MVMISTSGGAVGERFDGLEEGSGLGADMDERKK
jgi:hypothetical protein